MPIGDNDGDGFSTCDSDCNDYDASIGQTDADGDGSFPLSCFGNDCDDNDASLTGLDVDGDGQTSCAGDCDDNDASVFSGNTEVVGDGLDNDCDGVVE